MRRTKLLRAAIVLATVTGSTALAGSATAAPGPGWREITASFAGKRQADIAAELFRTSDVPTSTSDLRVFDLGNNDVLVLPKGIQPESVFSRQVIENGRVATEASASLIVGLQKGRHALAEGDGANADATVAAAAYWSQYDSGCFAWIRHGKAYMAPCYYTSKLINDGSSTRDYFALRQKASIGTEGCCAVNWDGWVQSVRTAGSAAQSWQDWEPGAEIRGGCSTVTLTVQARAVSIGISATGCERWEPGLYEDAGHFRNKWNCDCFSGVASLRQVASNIAVSVAQGRYPSWTISAGFKGF